LKTKPHIRLFARTQNNWPGAFDFEVTIPGHAPQRWSVTSWEYLVAVVKIMREQPGIGGGAILS